MERRHFLGASMLAGLGTLGSAAALAAEDRSGKQYLELRTYKMASAAKSEAFEAFLRDAAVPALNRIGIGPVGVFRLAAGDDPTLWLLLPHPSLESVVTLIPRLAGDAEFVNACGPMADAPMSDPVYQRFESSLLLGFDDCPKVEVPSKKDTRILQLRIYESHNEAKAIKKVAMFNEGGEIAIFRRVGLHPVFFGAAIIGGRMPNLTYMVGFDDKEAMDKAWAAFLADPAWTELKGKEEYKDTVSNITNLVLRPSPASQV